jgi:NAD(P)-dependent dehydrogenase (short-subunit alcohol dehydrogenase family)
MRMKTILITGVSSGLGRAMAREALARGHRVVGTLRNEDQRQAFGAQAPGRSFGRLLDVTDTAAIVPLVRAVEAEIGAIDVLVNNAGFGLRGVLEEQDLGALRQQFEVNLFGPVALIQAVLPKMRERRAGHIVNISSTGGIITVPGLSAYHGTKFAILGMTDTLAQEVARFGVRVTSVLPGVYDTDWRGRSQAHAEHHIDDYDALLSKRKDRPWGDPAAFARVVIDAIEMEEAPAHLLVGPTAVQSVRERLAKWHGEIDRWESLSQAGG